MPLLDADAEALRVMYRGWGRTSQPRTSGGTAAAPAGLARPEIIGGHRTGGVGNAGMLGLAGLQTGPHAAACVEGRALALDQAVAGPVALATEIVRPAVCQPPSAHSV